MIPINAPQTQPDSYINEIRKIKSSNYLTENCDKNLMLAKWFQKYINPEYETNLLAKDGHCACCAFRTVVHLKGGPLKKAALVGTNESKTFSDRFWNYFNPCKRTDRITVKYKDSIQKANEWIRNNTEPNSCILISICDGMHWLSAYHDESGDVFYIDSQTGKGFNLYFKPESDDEEYDLTFIIPSDDEIKQVDA